MSVGWFLFGWLLGGSGTKEVINYTPEQYAQLQKDRSEAYSQYCISRGSQPFTENIISASPYNSANKKDAGALTK